MKIRRIQYDVEFTHILTFQEEYRKKIATIFKEPNLRYGFENVGTIDESIKLVFTDLNFVVHCSKSAVRMMYEGDPLDFTKSGSPQWDVFSRILSSIKEIIGFGHLTRHTVQILAVHLFKEDTEPCELKNESIKSSKFIKFSPFSNYNDFAIMFDEGEGESTSKVTFGNFNFSDIKKFDLSPFETDYNSDLLTNRQGYIADIMIKRPITSFSKSNYRDLLKEVDNLITKFKI